LNTTNASWIVVLIASVVAASAATGTAAKRPLNLENVLALRQVADPRISPDGEWVAYAVTAVDPPVLDRDDTDLWMTSWDGDHTVQLVHSPELEPPEAELDREETP
jgi:hypothetical protein